MNTVIVHTDFSCELACSCQLLYQYRKEAGFPSEKKLIWDKIYAFVFC